MIFEVGVAILYLSSHTMSLVYHDAGALRDLGFSVTLEMCVPMSPSSGWKLE